jgi:hypothetical protein
MSIVVFCAGLVFGQLVLLIAVHILFLRGPIDIRRNRRRQLRDRVTGRTTQPSIVFAGGQRPAPPDSAVLDYFKYDPSRYQVEGEQCGWLNIGIGQLINVYRYSAEFHTALVRYLDQRMNGQLDQLATKTADGGTGQRLLDFVRVISIDLGSSYPQVLGSRVGYSETGSLRTELQFEWSDQISIAIETQYVLLYLSCYYSIQIQVEC